MSTTPPAPRLETRYRERLKGEDRTKAAQSLAEGYVAGASIRGLAEAEDMSYGTVRKLLLEVPVKLRGRGGARSGGSQ
ncbi:helix-turn-helix domain-containing protein [Streptomyces zaomyceticus]|uniref:helix-turn-helix domain-containing protein n=1 Tax=Streptomyces zaomyceticus TaxID=68286 RepID=UPI003790AA81